MKVISTNNSMLFTLLYKILYNSASKIKKMYIFINSHNITQTFRMSFFSQEFYQRDCYTIFAGKLIPWVHSNDDNFFQQAYKNFDVARWERMGQWSERLVGFQEARVRVPLRSNFYTFSNKYYEIIIVRYLGRCTGRQFVGSILFETNKRNKIKRHFFLYVFNNNSPRVIIV